MEVALPLCVLYKILYSLSNHLLTHTHKHTQKHIYIARTKLLLLQLIPKGEEVHSNNPASYKKKQITIGQMALSPSANYHYTHEIYLFMSCPTNPLYNICYFRQRKSISNGVFILIPWIMDGQTYSIFASEHAYQRTSYRVV